MSAAYLIRPVEPADADELGRLHVRVWREAYAGLIDAGLLAALSPERSAARFRRAADSGDTDSFRFRVAQRVADGVLAGFVSAGAPRDDDPPAVIELTSLYVDAAHRGTGVARKLTASVLGESPAYLWVLEGNQRAIAFYVKLGFRLDGVSKWDLRHEATDLRMVRA